ncbi:chemotaxis protein CheW [Aurantibacillus circumpalustris]|uniref:chemotaxis protein CheW n=1 Tax=Aurantibacillus circumpalustris TaxID=3036359 RepID=UPI00295BB9E3|nr:chemotaxis protein CheW [Aurantibacillus circumpalustris]
MNTESQKNIKQEVTNSWSYLSFELNNELLAIPVFRVLEIIEVPVITEVPKMPDFVKGVVNMRGEPLPVIDTRVKLGMNSIAHTVNTCIVVVNIEVENKPITVGILVDSVSEVFEISESEIQNSPLTGMKQNLDFVDGMIKVDDKFMMLVDINKIFARNEIDFLVREQEEVNA